MKTNECCGNCFGWEIVKGRPLTHGGGYPRIFCKDPNCVCHKEILRDLGTELRKDLERTFPHDIYVFRDHDHFGHEPGAPCIELCRANRSPVLDDLQAFIEKELASQRKTLLREVEEFLDRYASDTDATTDLMKTWLRSRLAPPTDL